MPGARPSVTGAAAAALTSIVADRHRARTSVPHVKIRPHPGWLGRTGSQTDDRGGVQVCGHRSLTCGTGDAEEPERWFRRSPPATARPAGRRDTVRTRG